jgi:hypothetical protein
VSENQPRLMKGPSFRGSEGPQLKRLCANNECCVAFAQLGEPAKLSRSNTGRVCFRCSERKMDADLEGCQGSRARARSTIRLEGLAF